MGSDRRIEVKFAFRQGGVHVSWQDHDGIGQDPGGIRSMDGSKMCASPRRTFRGRILTGLDGILVGSDRQMEIKFAFAEAGCTFRGRNLTGLDGILVGSDRQMEIKCAFRRGGVHVSWQDPDRIGRDLGGIRSTDRNKICVSPRQGARFVAGS